MPVTVTGGTGFLGGFLVRELLAKGVPVRVLARRSPRTEPLHSAGAEIVSGDLHDADSVARAVRGADVVYHLAAKVGAAARKDYFETNVAGTERVLAACCQTGVKQVVYASSLAVYGPGNEGEPIDESTPLDDRPKLRDPYAESKIAAEHLVSSFAKTTGISTVIIRPGIVFGPGRPLPIGNFGFRFGHTDLVFGNPRNRFPLNYVENLVAAMQAAATAGGGLRQYNLLDDDKLTLGRYHQLKRAADHTATQFYPGWLLYLGSPITETLRAIIPMGDFRLSPHQLRRGLQDRWYDTQLIRNQTGWRPGISLQDAIQRTLSATPL